MQNCSKLLFAKSSKPKISSTPIDKHLGKDKEKGKQVSHTHIHTSFENWHWNTHSLRITNDSLIYEKINDRLLPQSTAAPSHIWAALFGSHSPARIPPCLSCWAAHDWCAERSSRTRHCTEIWPSSPVLWWPEGDIGETGHFETLLTAPSTGKEKCYLALTGN